MLNSDHELDRSCDTALLNGHCHGAIQSVHVYFVFTTESMEIFFIEDDAYKDDIESLLLSARTCGL